MDLIEKLSKPIRRGDNYETLLYWIDVAHKMSDLQTMMEVDPPLFAIEDYQLDTKTDDHRLAGLVAYTNGDVVACEEFREQVLFNFVTDRISYYHKLLQVTPSPTKEGRSKQACAMVTEPLSYTPNGKIMWQLLQTAHEIEDACFVDWGTFKNYGRYDKKHVKTRGRIRSKRSKETGIRYLYRDPSIKYYNKRNPRKDCK